MSFYFLVYAGRSIWIYFLPLSPLRPRITLESNEKRGHKKIYGHVRRLIEFTRKWEKLNLNFKMRESSENTIEIDF